MSKQEKKEYIKKAIEEGDKRSWNEISADLELFLWSKRYNPSLGEDNKEEEEASQ